MSDQPREPPTSVALTLPRNSKPPLRVYAGMLFAVIVGRWIQLAGQTQGWEFDSGLWIAGFVVFATVATAWLALYLEEISVPLAVAWMSCVLVGGFVTAVMTPLLGAAIGFCVGGLTLFRHPIVLLASLGVPAKTNQNPLRLYVGILLAAVVARWILLFGKSAGWDFDTQPWPLILCVLACFFTGYLAWCLDGRLHRLVIWMACVLFAGSVTALMNPFPGAAIGFCIGGLAMVRRFALSVVLPSMLTGIVACVSAGWLWLFALASPGNSLHWWSMILPIMVGATLMVYSVRRLNRRWVVCMLGATPAFIIASTVVLPAYLNYRMDRIYDSISTIDVHPTWTGALISSVNPFAFAGGPAPPWLEKIDFGFKGLGMRPACGLGVQAYLTRETTPPDIQRLAKFPFVTTIHVKQGCPITDAEFLSLNTRGLGFLTCDDGTQLSDAAFENIECSHLQNLFLTGPNFGNGLAKRLSSIPYLAVISFDGTNITSEGLKQIDNTGPLYWLLLSNTQLDDEVFAILDRHNSLWRLDLSGTKINGSAIKNFRSFITNVEMSDTAFDAKHLADFLPPQGVQANPNNCLNVEWLTLANTKFNEDLFPSLMKMRKSLKFVDVAGSDLTLAQLKQLGLIGYGLDGELLTPQNIVQLGNIKHLFVHYDANERSISEIAKHFQAMQANAPADTRIVLRNAEMTRSSFKTLYNMKPRNFVNLQDARFPDGTVRSYKYLHEVLQHYDWN